MKRFVSIICVIVMVINFVLPTSAFCDNDGLLFKISNLFSSSAAEEDNSIFVINLDDITTFDELEDHIEKHVSTIMDSIESDWDNFSREIDSYEKYKAECDRVSAFYQEVLSNTNKLSIMLYEYCAIYARMIMDSNLSDEDKYEAVDGIEECIYEDACGEINDEIYEDILEDMHEYFYEDILDEQPNGVNYSEWSDMRTREYTQWYNTSSDVYAVCYDTSSKIYSFAYNLSSVLYSSNYDRAEKIYNRMLKTIEQAKNPDTDNTNPDAIFDTSLRTANTIDELETVIEAHVLECTQALYNESESLFNEIDTYQKYIQNPEKVSEFYQNIITRTEQISILLFEYGAVYARMILDSGMSSADKYTAAYGIKDCLHDNAGSIVYDEIYRKLINNMKDYYYDNVFYNARNEADYSEWYDARSEEYSQWYDTSSDVYSIYYDMMSDLYSFYYDFASELWSQEYDRAEKIYDKMLVKVERAKNPNKGLSGQNSPFDTTLRTADTVDELEGVIDSHVNDCLEAIKAEWSTFSQSIDTYEKYAENPEAVEEFYLHVVDSNTQILAMICNYGVLYTELTLQADSTGKEKYNTYKAFCDCLYDDACKLVLDEIYDELLKDMLEYLYDGVIKDAQNNINYSEWSDARSDNYSWWSDARGDVYGAWSDTRSNLYGFYSDVRSELYSQDYEGVNEEIQKFNAKIAKMG